MLSVAAVFWRHLFTGDVLFFRDVAFSHYPRAFELRQIVRAGLLPIWNPFEHFGEPIIANANYLLYYPTSWLAWVLPAHYGFKLHYVIHFFVLAAGSFLLARRAGLRPATCFFAGAVFVFSGPIMSLGNFYNLLPAVAWVPLALLAADYHLRRGGWRGATLFAGAFTLQLFAGEPFTSISTAGLVTLWAVVFFGDFHAPIWGRTNRGVFGRLVWGFLLTAGLAAIQVIPAVWHIRHTERAAQLTFLHTFFWSTHPLKFVEALLPEFWGTSLSDEGSPWLYLEGTEPFFLISMFIGIAPIALVVVAVIGHWRRQGAGGLRRLTIYWIAVLVGCTVLALGRYTPFSYVFYELVPVFRIVRFPVKFVLPAMLAVAQLAAIGAEYLLGASAEARRARAFVWLRNAMVAAGVAWLVLSVILLFWTDAVRPLIAALAAKEFDYSRSLHVAQMLITTRAQVVARATDWVIQAVPLRLAYVLGTVLLFVAVLLPGLRDALRRRLLYTLAAAAVVQLAATHYYVNPVVDRRFYETPVQALKHVAPVAAGPVRIYAEPPHTPRNQMPAPILIDLAQVEFLPPSAQVTYSYRLSLQAGWGLQGLESSFVADPEHILLEPQSLINKFVYERGLVGESLHRLLRIGSVQFAFFKVIAAPPRLERIGAGENTTTMPVQVYRVPDAAPRTYLVPASGAIELPTGIAVLHRLLSDEFNPERQVVLERKVLPDRPEGDFRGEAELLRRDALHADVRTKNSVPAYLVLTDSFNPEWRVTVDGKPATVLRANQMFRAVALEPGEHRVEFRYRPMSLVSGASVTFVTLLLAMFFVRREKRIHRRGAEVAEKQPRQVQVSSALLT